MYLRASLATAILLASAPALAAPGQGVSDPVARAEKDAITRCTMRQLHLPAGRGMGGSSADCTRIARAEVAALTKQSALASRETRSDIGKD